jgi:hypothetical protein
MLPAEACSGRMPPTAASDSERSIATTRGSRPAAMRWSSRPLSRSIALTVPSNPLTASSILRCVAMASPSAPTPTRKLRPATSLAADFPSPPEGISSATVAVSRSGDVDAAGRSIDGERRRLPSELERREDGSRRGVDHRDAPCGGVGRVEASAVGSVDHVDRGAALGSRSGGGASENRRGEEPRQRANVQGDPWHLKAITPLPR